METLSGCRSADRSLRSLTLTTPSGFGPIGGAAGEFTQELGYRASAGVLLAVDRRGAGTDEHLHGVVLVPRDEPVVERWCELTGANPDACDWEQVAGWNRYLAGDARKLVPNLTRVVRYALKPWPDSQGERELDEDVYASGALAAPWEAFRAEDGPEGAPDPDEPGKASPRPGKASLDCGHCGRPKPTGIRSHAVWCSVGCRRAASKQRRRVETGGGR